MWAQLPAARNINPSPSEAVAPNTLPRAPGQLPSDPAQLCQRSDWLTGGAFPFLNKPLCICPWGFRQLLVMPWNVIPKVTHPATLVRSQNQAPINYFCKQGVRTASGQCVINIICTLVEITFWESADQTWTGLPRSAVGRANGFGIYLFVHAESRPPEAIAKSASLLLLSAGARCYAGVHLILRFISSEGDCQSVS